MNLGLMDVFKITSLVAVDISGLAKPHAYLNK
jgi:hypothetical protein